MTAPLKAEISTFEVLLWDGCWPENGDAGHGVGDDEDGDGDVEHGLGDSAGWLTAQCLSN